jgi:hypothetical protein
MLVGKSNQTVLFEREDTEVSLDDNCTHYIRLPQDAGLGK